MPPSGASSFAKDPWRVDGLSFSRKFKALQNSSGKFNCSVLELFGTTGIRSFQLTRPHLESPKQFVGVENSPSVYLDAAQELLAKYPKAEDRPLLVLGDVFQVALAMTREHKPPVGICNFDFCNMSGQAKWWEAQTPVFRELVERGLSQWPCFILILNQALDGPHDPMLPSVRLKAQTEYVCKAFRQWGAFPARFLGPRQVLAEKADNYKLSLDDQALSQARGSSTENLQKYKKGTVGAYDVYVSRVVRMATLRLCFQQGRMTIDKEPSR